MIGSTTGLGAIAVVAVATLSPDAEVPGRESGQNNAQTGISRHGHSIFGWTFRLSVPHGFFATFSGVLFDFPVVRLSDGSSLRAFLLAPTG
jgi:hypothetical protein